MTIFEKLKYIGAMYETRRYTISSLANKLGMDPRELKYLLHLLDFYYGIKRTPENMPGNRLCNGVIFGDQIDFLKSYDLNLTSSI